jgi:hypothetical protein
MHRRIFIKNTSALAAATAFTPEAFLTDRKKIKNKLPKWKGFNLLDFFSPDPSNSRKATA